MVIFIFTVSTVIYISSFWNFLGLILDRIRNYIVPGVAEKKNDMKEKYGLLKYFHKNVSFVILFTFQRLKIILPECFVSLH